MHQRIVQIVALLAAITVHELSHAWMSSRLGDPTPRLEGRLTFNPLAHIDLIGTVLLPALLIFTGSPFLFGWAKPVHIDPRYYRNPLKGRALVSIAGPASNLAMAVAGGLLLKVPFLWASVPAPVSAPLVSFLFSLVVTNVVLAVFNLVPIPPLDGGHFVESVAPADVALFFKRMEPFGMAIIILLLSLGLLKAVLGPIYSMLVSLILH